MKKLHVLFVLPSAALACLAIAACVPSPQKSAPPPAAQPAPAAPPPPMPAPPVNWMDAPATPGDWTYRQTTGGSQALFGNGTSGTLLTLQCSRTAGQVLLVRPGDATGPVPMRIMTESETRTVTGTPDRGSTPSLVVSLAARDRLLDAMAISKGRFAVETAGLPTLYPPSWPEVTRVIEDCR